MKRQITQHHWRSIQDKLILDKGMTLDDAYEWMRERFVVLERK